VPRQYQSQTVDETERMCYTHHGKVGMRNSLGVGVYTAPFGGRCSRLDLTSRGSVERGHLAFGGYNDVP